MSPKSPNAPLKALIIAAFVLSLASAAAGGYIFYVHKTSQSELKKIEAVKIQLEDQVQTLQGQIESYEGQKADFIEKIDELDDQLILEKKKNITQLEELKSAQSEINSMRKQLAELSDKIEVFKKAEQMRMADDDAGTGQNGYPDEEVHSAIGRATSMVTEPFKALIPGSSEKQSVETKTKTTITKTTKSSGIPLPDARIKTVNRSFNFVVVNLGSDQGLSLGDQLLVRRNDREIGRVEIQKIYDRFASAKIISETSANVIQEGDAVEKL